MPGKRPYLVLMGTCLFLIVMAWSWVWLVSTTAAIVMSAVALGIPPLAAIVANGGRESGHEWDSGAD
ncbi:MAG TPA: hypothetical protein VHB69_12220 [Mycobacteriales bacterium]|nr:hypothetical protein [Mycobacteriales bacterium]